MKTINYAFSAASRDGVLRRTTKAVQVAEGDVIGGWQVTGVPTRGLNGLQWKCTAKSWAIQQAWRLTTKMAMACAILKKI